MDIKLIAPVDFSYYSRPCLMSYEGLELGCAAEGSIATPDLVALRTALFKVKTKPDLARWLNQAGYITRNKVPWHARDITESLRKQVFDLRDILSDWLTGSTVEELLHRFPTELVTEVCWTPESAEPEVFAKAKITTAGLTLPVLSPRIGLILSVHIDRFWRGRRLWGRCPKCKVVFLLKRPDQQFCSIRHKRAAGSLRYWHRKNASAAEATATAEVTK